MQRHADVQLPDDQVPDAPQRVPQQAPEDSLYNRLDMHPLQTEAKAGETTVEKMQIPGQHPAEYRLHLPKDYDGKEALPVVILYHGYGRTKGQGGTERGAEGMEEVSGLSELADKERFIAVFPNGDKKSSYSFNNGQWFFSKRDDEKYTERMLDELEDNLNIDKDRIYMVGYSQGGSFTHNIANKMSDRVAAVVENAGWMTGKEKLPESPFPIMSIQSKSDKVAPMNGNPWYSITQKPEAYTQDFYRRAAGITEAPQTEKRTGKDGSEIEEVHSANPQTGVEVRTMYLNNQRHLWYGGVGGENAPVDSTEEAWKFLKRFKLSDRTVDETVDEKVAAKPEKSEVSH